MAHGKAAPGSKGYFENIVVPGVRGKIIRAFPGRIEVILVTNAECNDEVIRQQYLNICKAQIPISQKLTVLVAKLCS